MVQLANKKQEIHVLVKVCSSDITWIFSTVYASSKEAERSILWNNLVRVVDSHSLPWVIVGDFNEPLTNNDKPGGRYINVNRYLLFKECLDRCNMIDLGFSRPRFTWTNRRGVEDLIQERIDRFFVNPGWYSLFPEARVTYPTRCHSDHCPVLLESQLRPALFLERPFKFQSF